MLLYIKQNFTQMMNATKFLILVLLCTGISVFFLTPAHAADKAPIVKDPSVLTARVNKKISIGNYVPADLVTLETFTNGSGFYIRKVAFSDLKALVSDMQAASVPVKINSAYRSFDDQTKLYNDGIAQNPKNSTIIAQPGFSEHQLGLALDFGAVTTGPAKGFANTSQSKWLAANGYKYGFALSYPSGKEAITGFTYEPWHWRYIGRDLAAEWKQSGLVLDQYLATKPQSYISLSLVGQNVKAVGDATVYYINANGTKRGFIAANAFLSYGYKWEDVLLVSPEQLLDFPETKVVKLQGDATVYQFNKDKTRQAISSAEAFKKLNYTWTDIVEINATELAGYAVGPIIK